MNTDGSVHIVGVGKSAVLRYNATSGQNRFRYFKSSTYTSQKAICLYKLVETTGGDTTCNHQWSEATHTDGKHTQTCTVEGCGAVDSTSYTISTKSDANGHWEVCSCGEYTTDAVAHTYGDDKLCDVCGYKNVVTANFVKVTSAPTDWSGTYLIVYEDGKVAFNSSLTTLDAANNGAEVTFTSDETITADEDYAFIIAAVDGGYTIQSSSGYYIGQTINDNGLKANQSIEYSNTITIDDGNATIQGSGGAYLRFNASSGDKRFRYYKSETYTNQKAITLYKLVTEEECLHEDKTYTSSSDTHHTVTCANSDCLEEIGSEVHIPGENNVCTACAHTVTDMTALRLAYIDAAYALSDGASLPGPITLTGVITGINDAWDSEYSNITVTIAVAGKADKPIVCYHMVSSNTANATAVAVGDTVTVTGTLTKVDGTVKFAAGCTLDACYTVKAVSGTLLYDEMIRVRIQYSITDGADACGIMIFSNEADAEAHTNAVRTADLVKGADGYYYGYSEGIAAKDMGDSAYYVGYAAYGEITVYSDVIEYSPKIYATNMLGKEDSSEATKNLCKALMNYGAAAQTYFGTSDALMNEGIDAVDYNETVLGNSQFSVNKNEVNGFTAYAATMLFEGAITYRIKYTLSDDLSGKTLYLEYTIGDSTKSVSVGSDGYAYITGIAPKDMDQVVTCKPYYLDENSQKVYGPELVYSGYEYSRRIIANSSNENMKALAKAFAMYIHYVDIAMNA